MWGDDAIVSGWAQAGAYFNKIQCFCFEEQRLRPHEKIDMPVTESLPISYFVPPTSWERRGETRHESDCGIGVGRLVGLSVGVGMGDTHNRPPFFPSNSIQEIELNTSNDLSIRSTSPCSSSVLEGVGAFSTRSRPDFEGGTLERKSLFVFPFLAGFFLHRSGVCNGSENGGSEFIDLVVYIL